MMIYNCCPLGYNYYNYRFFVRILSHSFSLGTGPGLTWLHPPQRGSTPLRSVVSSLPFPFVHFSHARPLSLSAAPSASFLPSPSLVLPLLSIYLREQRPDLRLLRCRNGFWKSDSRAESSRSCETSVSALVYVLSLLSFLPSFSPIDALLYRRLALRALFRFKWRFYAVANFDRSGERLQIRNESCFLLNNDFFVTLLRRVIVESPIGRGVSISAQCLS